MVHVPMRVRGRYDAAATTDENRRHWANADLLSANAANSPQVRKTLRSRARYEVANNSYARGIVSTLANDCIGTGPRLQMLTDDDEANRVVEQEFMRWADAVGLPEKLRTMRMARAESGEAFAMLVANPQVDSPVKLDLRLIEADQVATPDLNQYFYGTNAVDGIVFDAYGNPTEYHVLKSHPGDTLGRLLAGLRPRAGRGDDPLFPHRPAGPEPGHSRDHAGAAAVRPVAALHAGGAGGGRDGGRFCGGAVYRRPGQRRGRSGRADGPGGTGTADGHRAAGRMEARPNPGPATGNAYAEFKKEILNEIARCLNMPFNVAAGNSSGYNYASGRLDHQTYYKSIRVDQAQLGLTVLDRVLRAWLDEAILISGLLPLWMRTAAFRDLSHQWFWDGQEHVDPAKEANAQATRLQNHTTTLAYEYARQGRDWESETPPAGQRGQPDARVGALDGTGRPAANSNSNTDTNPTKTSERGGITMPLPRGTSTRRTTSSSSAAWPIRSWSESSPTRPSAARSASGRPRSSACRRYAELGERAGGDHHRGHGRRRRRRARSGKPGCRGSRWWPTPAGRCGWPAGGTR